MRGLRIVALIVALVATLGMTARASNATLPQEARGTAALQTELQGDTQDSSSDKDIGAVFAMTNVTAGNRIVVYRRASDGTLERVGRVPTRGFGIGTDLDTQGGLRLSHDHRFLYAVNAGSDDLSVFAVKGTSLRFVQKIAAGDEPVALTLFGDLLYVLNGSVAGNGIRGFRIAADGSLTPLADSFRKLSSAIAVPGTIQFSPDGKVILVTHKTTNELVAPFHIIDSFTIDAAGMPSAMPIVNESHGIRPFSLAFRNDGRLVVVESFNALDNKSAASSYQLNPDGTLALISGSVPNGQTDVCWVVITNDQRYAFTANFGSGTISSYRFESSGALTLINGSAASLGDMSQPVDLSLSADGRFLFLLLRGTGGVAAFRIEDGGSLTSLGTVVGGLPVNDGASGLAAY
ncbi:MAG: beta-propeller fold lactonase family protein [Roseiflexaceae bacterium]